MSWLDTLRRFFSPATPPTIRARLPQGRVSRNSSDALTLSTWVVAPPTDYETNWQLISVDTRYLERLSPSKLMEVLADFSPEVSRALWDFLRLCNPGYEIQALRPGTETPLARAQAALDAFIASLADQHGSFDVQLGRLNMGSFLRGASCAELVLDRRGRMPLDLATPDPASVRFRRRSDPERGEVWQPGQWQSGVFVPLDIPTFRYLPVDPAFNSPYGRPMASPALFNSLFLLGMFHDLKRVIQQQGYPRIDLAIDITNILEAAPQLASDDEAFDAYISSLVAEVQAAYSQLAPDDAYIHTSNVTVNRPVGTIDASSLGAVDTIIKALERMAARALKTMPLMLGITETVGDTQSNRQYEIFAAGIKAIQHGTEQMLERLFGLALEAQGIQASVRFRFAELRAAEMMRDAQTDAMRIANAAAKRDQGWITQDEASLEVVGHPAVEAEPEPPDPATPQPTEDNQDGQEQAARWMQEIKAARLQVASAMGRIEANGYH